MPIIIAAPRPPAAPSPGLSGPTRWTLSTPDGNSFALTGTGGFPRLRPAAQGLDAPPIQTFDTEVATAGGVWLGSRTTSRDVLLPVMLSARTDAEWLAMRREFLSAFTTVGDHVLTARAGDGTSRYLTCRYLAGAESPVEGELGADRYATYGIQMRAYDPWWYSDAISYTWVQADTGTTFFPGPPFVLAPGNVFGSVTVENPGPVDVWPEWRIDGPITTATFTGADGALWRFNEALAEGEWVVVKTDPRAPLATRVVDDAGANRWGDVTGDGDPFALFWPIQTGTNAISVAAAGSSGATKIHVSYRLAHPTW